MKNVYFVYYATVHSNRAVSEHRFPAALTEVQALQHVNRLNISASVYGVTYHINPLQEN